MMMSENNPGTEGQGRGRPPVPGPVPWLMYRHGEEELNYQAFCTISWPSGTNSPTFTVEQRTIPELHTSRILRACFHGWLLLSRNVEDDDDQLLFHFWNPITFESVELPQLVGLNLQSYYTCIFTSSPKVPGCTIFLFHYEGPNIVYCRLGGEQVEWSKYDYGMDLAQLFGEEYKGVTFQDAPACLNGLIYTFTYLAMHLVSIGVDDHNRLEIRSLNVKPPRTKQFSSRINTELLASFGELYAVEMNFHYTELSPGVTGVEVFKLDFSRMEWVDVTSMKDRSFFLGRNCSTSCLAIQSLQGNQIHFTKGDVFLYTYDMGYHTILASLPCQSMRVALSYWVTPDTPVVGSQDTISIGFRDPSSSMESKEESSEIYDHNEYLYEDVYMSIGRHLEKPKDYLHFLQAFQKLELASPPLGDNTSSQFPSPLLITSWNDKQLFSLTDPKHNRTYFLRSPEPFPGKFISCSKDGYLLLGDTEPFFLNPFTKHHGKIPKSKICLTQPIFSSTPASSDCLVVEISGWVPKVIRVRFVLVKGEGEEWQKKDFDIESEFSLNGNCPLVYGGKFYVLSEKGELGVFKMEGNESSWEVLKDLEAPCDLFCYSYLVECDGELMSVFMGCYGQWVDVYKLDFSEMKWVEVTSLGNYMLFVSRCGSFSAVATSPGMENKIYIPRLYDNHIVYYSLETNNFHTHGSDKAMDSFNGMEEQLYCSWIQPPK